MHNPFSFRFSRSNLENSVLNLLAFQIQWKVRAQLSVTAESCFCPFFRLLARVHSIPFRLVCAGRGRRGSVCGVDRSISRMKDRVNENKWYFQRLFDSDFFFFFSSFRQIRENILGWKQKLHLPLSSKVKAWCAKGEKHDVFFEKADRFLNLSLSVKINSRSPLIFLGSPNSALRHVKTRLILNPAFGTNWK